jgi:hypothetical protein
MNTKQQRVSLRNSGSFFNYLMGNNASVPKVGEGGTYLLYTDRHAFEVWHVSGDGKRVFCEWLNAKRIDNNGMSESQSYEYSPSGRKFVLRWRYNGWRMEYVENGKICFGGRVSVIFGVKREYYDYSF